MRFENRLNRAFLNEETPHLGAEEVGFSVWDWALQPWPHTDGHGLGVR